MVAHFVNVGGIIRPSLFKLSLHKNALPFHAHDTFNNSLQCIFSFSLCFVSNLIATCVDGTYGQNCSQDCSDNCYNKTCHVVSGKCLSGCRKGWIGPFCKQSSAKSDDNYTAVYIGIGASIVAALIVVIIVLVTLRYRRKKQQSDTTRVRGISPTMISEVHHTEPHCVSAIPMVQEQHYDTIQTPPAVSYIKYNKSA